MTWFVKQRRAQSVDDFETWIEGGVSPTLNAFDNTGDSRATVIIFDNSYRDGLRIQKGDTVNTLSAKMGTGGNNVPFVAREVPVLMRQREGKPSGGKDPLLSENMFLTLAGGNDQVLFEPVLTFDGYNQSTSEDMYPALRIGIDSGDRIAIPIDMRNALRDPEKYDEVNRQGLGVGKDGEPSHTVTGSFVPGVATGEIEETIMQVRRLTPIECERLMGWADNHTLPRADGKQNADTTRYKMCGNGVASPVAAWIGNRLMEIQNAPRNM